MGVQPPPSESESEQGAIDFGIAEIDAYLKDADISYPITQDELVETLDNPSIAYDASGNTIKLSDAFERIEQNQFEQEQEIKNALYPVFEDLRESPTPGFLSWLRSLFS